MGAHATLEIMRTITSCSRFVILIDKFSQAYYEQAGLSVSIVTKVANGLLFEGSGDRIDRWWHLSSYTKKYR